MEYLLSDFAFIDFVYSNVSCQVEWIRPECGRYAIASSRYMLGPANIYVHRNNGYERGGRSRTPRNARGDRCPFTGWTA